MPQMTDHRLGHVLVFDFREFEHQRRSDVRLLMCRLAYVELTGLAVVVGEALGADAAPLA